MRSKSILFSVLLILFSTSLFSENKIFDGIEHDQTSLFYSIMAGVQLEMRLPIPQSMYDRIIQLSYQNGYLAKTNKIVSVLSPESIINLVLEMINKSEYSCDVKYNLEIEKCSFIIKYGKDASGEVHYNLCDLNGIFTWDPISKDKDLIEEPVGFIAFSIHK